MKLYDLLKEVGLPANEIKARLAQNIIKVNGESKGRDYDLGPIKAVYDEGFFFDKLYELPNYEKHYKQLKFFGIENLMSGESNIENELTDFLKNFKLIQLSRESFIIVETTDTQGDVYFHREETSQTGLRKIETPQEKGVDIEKLKGDKAKVEKQLNNPGFLNNAPQFKIDAAKKRLEKLNQMIADAGGEVSEKKILKFSNFKNEINR